MQIIRIREATEFQKAHGLYSRRAVQRDHTTSATVRVFPPIKSSLPQREKGRQPTC